LYSSTTYKQTFIFRGKIIISNIDIQEIMIPFEPGITRKFFQSLYHWTKFVILMMTGKIKFISTIGFYNGKAVLIIFTN